MINNQPEKYKPLRITKTGLKTSIISAVSFLLFNDKYPQIVKPIVEIIISINKPYFKVPILLLNQKHAQSKITDKKTPSVTLTFNIL